MPLSRRRRRRSRSRRWSLARRIVLAVGAIPLLYLLVALAGSLIPVNSDWDEPKAGTIIYVADNGIHADLVLPVRAQGLDWTPYFPSRDFATPPLRPQYIAFGAGERRVYLDTPRWRDIRLSTIWRALMGGERVIHVEYVASPPPGFREIRLRPEEYRRLWAAIRAELELGPDGRPRHIDHPGYGPSDAFYHGLGKASALRTCNSWTADKLRLAGVETSLWPPFVQGLVWRYRTTGVAT